MCSPIFGCRQWAFGEAFFMCLNHIFNWRFLCLLLLIKLSLLPKRNVSSRIKAPKRLSQANTMRFGTKAPTSANVVARRFTVQSASLRRTAGGRASTRKSPALFGGCLTLMVRGRRLNASTAVPTWDTSSLASALPKKTQDTALTRFRWILSLTKKNKL